MGQVLNVAEELYSAARWRLPSRWCSAERIKFLVEHKVNRKASPGYPYCVKWPTNEELLKAPQEGGLGVQGLVEMVLRRLREYAVHFEMGTPPGEVPVEALCDPVRLFVKWEPHTVEKAALGRWRLIWSVSVVDQLVDSLLWEESLAAEIANYRRIPSKPGFSPAYGGYDDLFSSIDDGSKNIVTKDMQGWDWTMPGWYYWADTKRRFRLCLDDTSGWFQWLALARTRCECCGWVVFSDGTVLVQNLEGINRSGGKRTISINGFGQIGNKIIAAIRKKGAFSWKEDALAAMGDDALERLHGFTPDEYSEVLRDLGFRVKYVDQGPIHEMDFCSRSVIRAHGQWVPIPMNWDKHRYVLKCHENRQDVLAQALSSILLEYAFDDEKFSTLRALLIKLEPKLARSQAFAQSLVTGIDFPQNHLLRRGSAASSVESGNDRNPRQYPQPQGEGQSSNQASGSGSQIGSPKRN